MQLLHGHKKAVNGVAFSPDGALLASAASDGVCVWDLATGKPRWRADAEYADQPAFSPDGESLVVVGLGLGRWNVATGSSWEPISFEGEPLCCAFSPGDHFVVGTDDDEDKPRVHRFSFEAGAWKEFPVRSVPIQCCAFRPDGKVLATAGKSQIALCDGTSGKQLATAKSPTRHDSLALVWSPDARLLLHAAGRTVSVRDGRTLAEVAVIQHPKRYFLDVAMHPGGRFIATASKDGVVQFWDTTAWTELRTFAWGVGGLRCVTFAADGLRAACGGDKGKIVVWDVDL
jgi:WD40 repeat protein